MRKLLENDILSVIGLSVSNYKIIQARVKEGNFSDSDHYGIALGKNDNGNYATWQFKLAENNECFDFYWGHYHMENMENAIKDYNTRTQ